MTMGYGQQRGTMDGCTQVHKVVVTTTRRVNVDVRLWKKCLMLHFLLFVARSSDCSVLGASLRFLVL